jgi:hypothetical protein
MTLFTSVTLSNAIRVLLFAQLITTVISSSNLADDDDWISVSSTSESMISSNSRPIPSTSKSLYDRLKKAKSRIGKYSHKWKYERKIPTCDWIDVEDCLSEPDGNIFRQSSQVFAHQIR